MLINDLLQDALQWLKDCGGVMAMSNNPMSHQLIKAGYAKRGGYNHLGQRTLILVSQPGDIQASNPPGIPMETYQWSRQPWPVQEEDILVLNDHIMEIHKALQTSCTQETFVLPQHVKEMLMLFTNSRAWSAAPRTGFMLFSLAQRERFFKTCRLPVQWKWYTEERHPHTDLGLMGLLLGPQRQYMCLDMVPLPKNQIIITDQKVQNKTILEVS